MTWISSGDFLLNFYRSKSPFGEYSLFLPSIEGANLRYVELRDPTSRPGDFEAHYFVETVQEISCPGPTTEPTPKKT